MVKAPKYQIEKMIRARGIDPQTIDYNSLWDRSLTRKESFGIIRKKINILRPPERTPQKGQYSTRIIKRSKRQTGTSNTRRDRSRTALPSGKRQTWYGSIYYENRKNRSDLKNKL